MSEQDQEQDVALEHQEDADLDTANEAEDLRAKLAKAEELAENQRIRAEKAERKARESKTQAVPKQEVTATEFDLEDVAVLVSKVHNKEDRELVKTWAKRENKTLEEMLNDNLVTARLKEREEQRKTAEVANTSPSRRTTTKVTGETILENARDGKFPTSDEEIAKLARAHVDSLRKK